MKHLILFAALLLQSVTKEDVIRLAKDGAKEEEILKKIEAQHIDAAITFRLVPLGKQEESAWDAEWMRQTQEAGTLRELIASSLPLKLEKSETYGVEVTLWAEAAPARQWTARTAPHSIKALRQGSTELIQDVIQTLRYYHKI